jgi:hypothetical protein
MQMALHRLFNHFLIHMHTVSLWVKKENLLFAFFSISEKQNVERVRYIICFIGFFSRVQQREKLINQIKRKKKIIILALSRPHTNKQIHAHICIVIVLFCTILFLKVHRKKGILHLDN